MSSINDVVNPNHYQDKIEKIREGNLSFNENVDTEELYKFLIKNGWKDVLEGVSTYESNSKLDRIKASFVEDSTEESITVF